jgi:hypothetical protein
LQSENLGSPISADQSGRIYFETGRSVRSSVKTVVGQHSRPVSIAARSLRQNSSSCLWRRAIASTLPSSTIRFRFDMVSPPSIRVGDAVTRTSSPALAEERVRDFEVLFSPRTPSTSSNVGVFGARPRRSCTEALSRPKRSCVHPPTATHCFWPTRGERDQRHALKLEFNFIRDIAPVAGVTSIPSWSTHRFGSRPFPNSSPMPKPIRVSPWRRLSALVPPSRPRNSRISSSATSSSSRCGPSSARRSKNAARLKREIEFDRRRAAQIQSTNHRHNYG